MLILRTHSKWTAKQETEPQIKPFEGVLFVEFCPSRFFFLFQRKITTTQLSVLFLILLYSIHKSKYKVFHFHHSSFPLNISLPFRFSVNAAVVQPISTSTAPNLFVPTDQNNSDPTASETLNADVAKPTNTFTSHKNKLQEYCQKSKIELPVYSCQRENGVFTCTVHVAGRSFSSNGCNTKKGSEQTAANIALKALGLI